MRKDIDNGITILTADGGMKLTNGEVFGSHIRLGVGDSESNWHEITAEEAERRMAEAEEDEISDTEEKAHAFDILMGVNE